MLILALDTTTRSGSIALMRDEVVVGAETGDVTRTHGERLPGEISRLLTRHDVPFAEIDLYAVASGPGSFTGLRIGIATMQGLAFAHNKPLAGISALDAFALAAQTEIASDTPIDPPGFLAVWMDAHRGEVFGALYAVSEMNCLEGPLVAAPAEMLSRWRPIFGEKGSWFVGDGALTYRAVVEAMSENSRIIDPGPMIAPAIGTLAARAAAAGRLRGPEAIRPLYVRRPDAELARDRAKAKANG